MDLMFDYDRDGYYWQIFDYGTQRTSQLFESPSEAWAARRENRLLWY